MTAVQHILRVIEGDVVKPCLEPTHILDNMRNYCKGIGLFRDGAPKGVPNNIKHDIGAAIVETKGSTQKVSFSAASKVTGFSRRFLASCAEERRLSLEDGVVNLALRERRSDAFMIEYKEFIDAFCHDTNQFTRIDTNRTDGVQIINPFTGKKEAHRRKTWAIPGDDECQRNFFLESGYQASFEKYWSEKYPGKPRPKVGPRQWRLLRCGCVFQPTDRTCVDYFSEQFHETTMSLSSCLTMNARELLLLEKECSENGCPVCSPSWDTFAPITAVMIGRCDYFGDFMYNEADHQTLNKSLTCDFRCPLLYCFADKSSLME